MKNDIQLKAALDFIKNHAPKAGTKFNEGQPGGAFVYLGAYILESSLQACGLFTSEETHINWLLSIPSPEYPFQVPGEGTPVVRCWSDFLVRRETPHCGDVYEHYKGGRYRVDAVALAPSHEDHKIDFMVLYTGLENGTKGKAWAREAGNFFEKITLPRFAKVSS